MKDKVSVIIPVYNASKYIRTCLDSVINQTYSDVEIILIDDGSPDDCGKIIDEYAGKDERIIALHTENNGVSVARNLGIDNATGRYIQFVDSDDFLEPKMIERMVHSIKSYNCDMVMCGFFDMNLSHTKEVLPAVDSGRYSKEEYLECILNDPYALDYGVLWNKLFKRKYFNENTRFNDDMDFGEDFIFCLKYLKNAHAIGIIKKAMYNYVRFNSNSLMYIHAKEKKTASEYIEYMNKRILIYERFKEYFSENELMDKYSKQVYEYMLRFFIQEKLLIKMTSLSLKDKKECVNYLEQHQYYLEAKDKMPLSYKLIKAMKYKLLNLKLWIRTAIVVPLRNGGRHGK